MAAVSAWSRTLARFALALPAGGCAAILPMPAPDLPAAPPPLVAGTALRDWKGVIHCHGFLSHDSKGTFAEIAAAAHAAGMAFVVMTDHQTERSVAEGRRGEHDGLLWLCGVEAGGRGRNLLAFPVQRVVQGDSVRAMAADARAQGALVFLDHAEGARDWDVPDLDGVEIVNLHAGAYLAPHLDMILAGLFFPVRALMAMTCRRVDGVFTAWDAQLQRRHPLTPVGGNDAHANVRLFGPLGGTIGTYRECFLTLSTHVLCERLDEGSLLAALKAGRTYVSCDVRGEGSGFDFRGEAAGRVVLPGDTVPAGGLTLQVRTPLPGEIALLRDGVVVQRAVGTSLVCPAPLSGVHRVEVTREGRPWLFSSTIRVVAD